MHQCAAEQRYRALLGPTRRRAVLDQDVDISLACDVDGVSIDHTEDIPAITRQPVDAREPLREPMGVLS